MMAWAPTLMAVLVAPVRERGLKFDAWFNLSCVRPVAPVRERGLKFRNLLAAPLSLASLP